MKDAAGPLLQLTDHYLPRSRCPYSGKPASAVVLLADGSWIPGVRVESASFSLAIDAAVNALSTAASIGRTDIAAVALSHKASAAQTAHLADLGLRDLQPLSDRLFVSSANRPLPDLTTELDPRITLPTSDEEGIEAARSISGRAYIPESAFPVGCVALVGDTAIPGVNVEHADWNRIICAERNALGTAVSYALDSVRRMYLSCPLDPAGSPCGACRQVLAELAPDSTIVMDRNSAPPHMTTPEQLLPGSFTGSALPRRHMHGSHRPPGP